MGCWLKSGTCPFSLRTCPLHLQQVPELRVWRKNWTGLSLSCKLMIPLSNTVCYFRHLCVQNSFGFSSVLHFKGMLNNLVKRNKISRGNSSFYHSRAHLWQLLWTRLDKHYNCVVNWCLLRCPRCWMYRWVMAYHQISVELIPVLVRTNDFLGLKNLQGV